MLLEQIARMSPEERAAYAEAIRASRRDRDRERDRRRP
jgi:hypothetical protein